MSNHKILIVEDEYALQHSLSQAFKESGFQVFSATNGEEGVMMAKKDIPDLILLDLVLPRKDGLKVLEELKADSSTARIPVLILSNVGENYEIGRAMELGAQGYLVKTDYKLNEVVEKAKELLKK